MQFPFDQLKDAGPWLTVAAIVVALMGAMVKVMVIDHSLVPWELLAAERKRTDAALAVGAESIEALKRVTESLQDLKMVTEGFRRELQDLKSVNDEVRRELNYISRSQRRDA